MVLRDSLAAVVIVVILAASPLAGAGPTAITPSYIAFGLDLQGEGTTLDPGQQSEGFALTDFCHGVGGLNPFQGMFVYTYAIVAKPEWLDVRIVGGSEQWDAPPLGPTLHEDCYSLPFVSLRMVATEDAPRDALGVVEMSVSVATAGNTGTYQTPAGTTASATIRTSAAP